MCTTALQLTQTITASPQSASVAHTHIAVCYVLYFITAVPAALADCHNSVSGCTGSGRGPQVSSVLGASHIQPHYPVTAALQQHLPTPSSRRVSPYLLLVQLPAMYSLYCR